MTDLQGAPQPQQCLSMSINSLMADTVLVAMAVRGVCGMTSLNQTEINHIELCVVEVVNNAIEHAYKGEAGHSVGVDVVLSPGERLEIIIRDQGQSMPDLAGDKKSITEPDPGDPDTWMVSGRGLPIVEQLMDDIQYKASEAGNAFTMVRRLN